MRTIHKDLDPCNPYLARKIIVNSCFVDRNIFYAGSAMEIGHIFILFGAGLIGGTVNAIAGGGTLFTFPAMLAVGLPPIMANASNAVAVSPGHILGAIADRSRLSMPLSQLIAAVLIAVTGGIVGAALLLSTTDSLFSSIVPLLLLSATFLFAFGPKLSSLAALAGSKRLRPVIVLGLMLASLYGGFFGAGFGVLLLAALIAFGISNLRDANALKNVLAASASLGGILIFVIGSWISWSETFLMFSGAAIGGFIGGRLSATLKPDLVRFFVLAMGVIMTIYYAHSYWF